jgi:hypothetical protein
MLNDFKYLMNKKLSLLLESKQCKCNCNCDERVKKAFQLGQLELLKFIRTFKRIEKGK